MLAAMSVVFGTVVMSSVVIDGVASKAKHIFPIVSLEENVTVYDDEAVGCDVRPDALKKASRIYRLPVLTIMLCVFAITFPSLS
jgi:hypothetical protein